MSRRVIDVELYTKMYWKRYRALVLLAPLAILAALALSTAFYTVEADSEAVVLRFGAYQRTTSPGLHGKLPWPIETVRVVPVLRVQTIEFGFETIEPGRVTVFDRTEEHEQIALMLTGDLNLAHVEWIVQYRIKDAMKYLFKIGGSPNPAEAVGDTIRDVSEAVMRRLLGDVSVDEVITIGREKIADEAAHEMQAMLDNFETGVEIVTVKLQAATPPEPVKDAFEEVNRARQNKERAVNEARGERNRQIPAARGERDKAISEAEGYHDRVVKEITGRGNAFLAQLKEYEKVPEVTRTRLYLEAMERVLTQVDEKIIIDESVRSVLPLLSLDPGDDAARGRKGGAR